MKRQMTKFGKNYLSLYNPINLSKLNSVNTLSNLFLCRSYVIYYSRELAWIIQATYEWMNGWMNEWMNETLFRQGGPFVQSEDWYLKGPCIYKNTTNIAQQY